MFILCCWFFAILKLLVLEYSTGSLLTTITNNSLRTTKSALIQELPIADKEWAKSYLYFSWEHLAHHQKWLSISSAIAAASSRTFTIASIANIPCIAPWIAAALWTNAVHVAVMFICLRHQKHTLEMLNEGIYVHWISSACVSVDPCTVILCYSPPQR